MPMLREEVKEAKRSTLGGGQWAKRHYGEIINMKEIKIIIIKQNH